MSSIPSTPSDILYETASQETNDSDNESSSNKRQKVNHETSSQPPPTKKLVPISSLNKCANARLRKCIDNKRAIEEYKNGLATILCTACNQVKNPTRNERLQIFKKWNNEFIEDVKKKTCDFCHKEKPVQNFQLFTPAENKVLVGKRKIGHNTHIVYWIRDENFKKEKYIDFLTKNTLIFCKDDLCYDNMRSQKGST